ncbi:MAG: DUF192 domain-containing protein [Elusimicrobia bacterium]|nr:DUF192 domain-containing protein [Candidatus Liberimonas magnetica]
MDNRFKTLFINGRKTEYNIKVAGSFFEKLVGWMFIKVPSSEGLLLSHCNSIHTFFMRFQIDIIFRDKEGRVVRIIEGLKPYRVVLPVKNACQVLELSSNTVKAVGLKMGDIVEIA